MTNQLRPSCRHLLAVLLLAMLSGHSLSFAERYDLQMPGRPEMASSAELAGDRLRITDAAGKIYRYTRVAEVDSADGRYRAYFCRSADRYLRWPVAGSGAMYLGTAVGGRIDWQPSQMQVVRRGPWADDGGRMPTGVPQGLPGSPPATFATATGPEGRMVAATLSADGSLDYYAQRNDGWQRLESVPAETLDPHSSLALLYDGPQRLPDAYLVDAQGQLLRVRDGQLARIRDVGMPQLDPYTQLGTDRSGASPDLHAIDRAGDLWELDVRNGHYRRHGGLRGRLVPGGPVTIVGQRDRDRYAVDREGRLLVFERDLAASATQATERVAEVGTGLVPGSPVAATFGDRADGGAALYLAAFRREGGIRLLERTGDRWRDVPANDLHVAPGASVALLPGSNGIRVSSIGRDGTWQLWQPDGSRWVSEVISEGLSTGTPIGFAPGGSVGFAVDRRGRLVAAEPIGGRWRCCLCAPGYAFAPQLVSRRVVANAGAGPVRVALANSHSEELVVRIYDRRAAGDPMQVSIQPGETWTIQADRDPGAVWEEVFLVPGPGGALVEQVRQWPVPAQILYDVAVYANRVTSVYFDRTTNRSNVPDSTQTSLVSLGVFPLPPGAALRDGERIDAYAEARRQGNPGAAAWFGRP